MRKVRRLVIAASVAALAAAIGFCGTGGRPFSRQEGKTEQVVSWRGMKMPVPECFVADAREHDLHLRSTGWCGTVPLERGTAWLSVLYRPEVGQVQPFETWEPCAEFDQCRTSRKRSRNVELECYSAITHMEHGELRRNGCRSVERRLAIRYVCLEFFCDELENASLRAWASLAASGEGERTAPTRATDET